MGLLAQWDRRNQRILEEHNRRADEDLVAPGVVAVHSVSSVLKIAPLTLVAMALLVMQDQLWCYVAAVGVGALGTLLCWVLARDARTDAAEWRSRRASRRNAPT